ncbi:hypothetical protein ACFL54_01880 [Planctomycetota bacterium]
MTRSKDTLIVMMLMVIAVLMILNLFATRFEMKVAKAGGGVQGNGWIAFAGQKNDGPETVYIVNTTRGPARQLYGYNWNDNGPRFAVYRINGQGKIKFTSMRNVGPDLDVYLEHLFPDSSGMSPNKVRKENKVGRDMANKPGEDDDDDLPELPPDGD